jgi:hypothetical protein
MSKAEIHSWITTAQHEDASDDGQDTVDIASATINEEEDWVQFMLIAQRRLLGDGTRGRIEFLKEQLGVVANRGGECEPIALITRRLILNRYITGSISGNTPSAYTYCPSLLGF